MQRILWFVSCLALVAVFGLFSACGDDGESCNTPGDCDMGSYCGPDKTCVTDCASDAECTVPGETCVLAIGACSASTAMNRDAAPPTPEPDASDASDASEDDASGDASPGDASPGDASPGDASMDSTPDSILPDALLDAGLDAGIDA